MSIWFKRHFLDRAISAHKAHKFKIKTNTNGVKDHISMEKVIPIRLIENNGDLLNDSKAVITSAKIKNSLGLPGKIENFANAKFGNATISSFTKFLMKPP